MIGNTIETYQNQKRNIREIYKKTYQKRHAIEQKQNETTNKRNNIEISWGQHRNKVKTNPIIKEK